MQTLVKTRNVGGSLMTTIPKEVVEELGIIKGELIRITVEKIKKSYFGKLKGIGKFKEEDRLDSR